MTCRWDSYFPPDFTSGMTLAASDLVILAENGQSGSRKLSLAIDAAKSPTLAESDCRILDGES